MSTHGFYYRRGHRPGRMHIHVTKDDIVEGPTDDRGRVYLGPEYANSNVEVAVLEAEGVEG